MIDRDWRDCLATARRLHPHRSGLRSKTDTGKFISVAVGRDPVDLVALVVVENKLCIGNEMLLVGGGSWSAMGELSTLFPPRQAKN